MAKKKSERTIAPGMVTLTTKDNRGRVSVIGALSAGVYSAFGAHLGPVAEQIANLMKPGTPGSVEVASSTCASTAGATKPSPCWYGRACCGRGLRVERDAAGHPSAVVLPGVLEVPANEATAAVLSLMARRVERVSVGQFLEEVGKLKTVQREF